jgi:hypothetical protein
MAVRRDSSVCAVELPAQLIFSFDFRRFPQGGIIGAKNEQISTDHVRHISLDPFRSNTPNRESNDGKSRYDRAASLIVAKVRPAHTPMKVLCL